MSNYVRAIAASLAAVLLVIAGCGDPVPQPPKEKAVGAKQATTSSNGISLSGIFDYPDAARDESEVALTYMNKKKNNFDSVMGLKPQSPAKERNKRDTENITP